MAQRSAFPFVLAGSALLLLAGTLAPVAAAADDMAVKMQWDETLYRDEVSKVILELTNLNDQYLMNVTSAGLYIDWMRLGTFETNTSSFLLPVGESKVMSILFRVPVDARYGKHSDYVVIKYTLKNDTSGVWTNGTFESTINKDFTVLERPAKAPEWFALTFSNPLCVVGLVVVVLVAAGAMARRLRRTGRILPEPPKPPPEPAPVEPVPPPPPEEKKPEGPEKCPYCGAPFPGKHCQNCGWDIG